MRGTYASSRTLRRDAVDAGARKDEAPRMRTAKPCGPDAPTLAFKLATILPYRADEGGKKARSPGRARSKPLKPLRRECRVDPASPVVTNSCVFVFYTRGCGCNGHPAFPAPLLRSPCASPEVACALLLRAHLTNPDAWRRGTVDVRHPGITRLRVRRAPLTCRPPGVSAIRKISGLEHLEEKTSMKR